MTPLWLRFAARELRSGVKGFRIFLACLALGVAAIAAASSTAEAFRQGLASEAREILGGDLAVSVGQRRFAAGERGRLMRLGRVSYAVASPAMAEAPGGERRLIELRGVDETYPLAGTVAIAGAPSLQAALAYRDGVWGAAVEQGLLDRTEDGGGYPRFAGRWRNQGRVRHDKCSDSLHGECRALRGRFTGDSREVLHGRPMAPHHTPGRRGQTRRAPPVGRGQQRYCS